MTKNASSAARAPRFTIILAGGKGTRMQSDATNKVCLPIQGRPAIHWAMELYDKAGVRQHVVVVGALAGQVVETVGAAFDNAVFVYQAEQLGTAHAARVGLSALEALDDEHEVLLVAGDRIISEAVLREFFGAFYETECDLMVLACPAQGEKVQGHIVQDEAGRLLGIVEAQDIRQRRVYRRVRELALREALPSNEALRAMMTESFSARARPASETKLAVAFGELWRRTAPGAPALTPADGLALAPEELTRFAFDAEDGGAVTLTPEQVDGMPLANNSVYVVKIGALRHALENLDRDNAQHEEYLSAMPQILGRTQRPDGRSYRVRALDIDRAGEVLGYNDPAEFLEVETALRAWTRQGRPEAELAPSEWFRTLVEWRAAVEAAEAGDLRSEFAQELARLYSEGEDDIRERLEAYRGLLDYASGILEPDQRALIVRSPGRVNVMGRHVDHQGGNCNLMTIGYETLMLVRPRDDDRIRLFNADSERFPPGEFSIGELIEDLPWDDWMSLVNSEKLSRMLRTYGGDWSQYIMAGVLRLQKQFKDTRLRGMDMVVAGNVPIAAGLSSSSSLVVGAVDAAIAVNRLDTSPTQLVDLCGEGEWFVGTRGGSADHAAIKLGQQSRVIKVGFFEFRVEETVPFPEQYVMALCNSGISAKKSANAKDQFNHRIACYRIGFKLINKLFPQYRPLLKHLRDVNTQTLGVPLGWIYKILLRLPEQSTRAEVRALLPDDPDLDTIFASHEPPPDGRYPVRGVVLFGLAECARSAVYTDLLKAGRIDEIGRMMNVSHNGDRVACFLADGTQAPYEAPASDAYLLELIDALESGETERVIGAQLEWQPGAYGCSLPEIDRMVDIALATPGVRGAQLAGAGLGGCMMVLTEREAVDSLCAALDKDYFKPAGKPASILVCKPVAGAGVLMQDAKR